MVTYLDEDAVRRLLHWHDLIPALEDALAKFSSGRVLHPVRNVLTIEERQRYLGIMPAVTDEIASVKVINYYPRNEGTGVPTHLGVIVLFRADTGEPLAVMDGRLVTEMRTAGVSAAVTRRLMPPESRVLAILGSGVQAQAHLEALQTIHQFDEVRVWSRMPDHAQHFASKHGATAMDAEAAVRAADVIVTATNAHEPVLKGAWLKRGAHVNSVGANRPTWRELDDEVMRNTVVVDSREATLQESGDVINSKATIAAEIGELFAGTKSIPRTETTVFKSVGLAVEDLAAAQIVYEAASRNNVQAASTSSRVVR
ncbi:MAG: ornithine cyclodeaminase family protein [Candidatus Eremiobacteraeota bacterium]|nr:ornithine cyclodeaminase family protein [Candidatus Eremiobacteraeota bacterium]